VALSDPTNMVPSRYKQTIKLPSARMQLKHTSNMVTTVASMLQDMAQESSLLIFASIDGQTRRRMLESYRLLRMEAWRGQRLNDFA
jgi:hypothetical protein